MEKLLVSITFLGCGLSPGVHPSNFSQGVHSNGSGPSPAAPEVESDAASDGSILLHFSHLDYISHSNLNFESIITG